MLVILLPGGDLAHIRREKVTAGTIVVVSSMTSRWILVPRTQVPQAALPKYPHELSVYSPESNRTVDTGCQHEAAHAQKHDLYTFRPIICVYVTYIPDLFYRSLHENHPHMVCITTDAPMIHLMPAVLLLNKSTAATQPALYDNLRIRCRRLT